MKQKPCLQLKSLLVKLLVLVLLHQPEEKRPYLMALASIFLPLCSPMSLMNTSSDALLTPAGGRAPSGSRRADAKASSNRDLETASHFVKRLQKAAFRLAHKATLEAHFNRDLQIRYLLVMPDHIIGTAAFTCNALGLIYNALTVRMQQVPKLDFLLMHPQHLAL